jgi:hypothetical protein
MWASRRDIEGRHQREPYEQIWDRSLQYYMDHARLRLPRGAEWMSKKITADYFVMCEEQSATVASNILGNKRVYSVEADSMDGQDVRSFARNAIEHWRRKSHYDKLLYESLRIGMAQGHFVHKNVFHQEIGEKAVPAPIMMDADGQPVGGGITTEKSLVFNGPRTYRVDLKRYWKSAQKDHLGRPIWAIEELIVDMNYLKYINEEFKSANVVMYKNLDQLDMTHSYRQEEGAYLTTRRNGFEVLNPSYPTGRGISNHRSSRATTTQQSEYKGESIDSIYLYQCWGWVPPDQMEYEDTQWRMMTFAGDGVLIRDIPAPTPDRRPPYRDNPLIQIGDEPYGRSPLHWTMGEIDNSSQLRALRIAEAWISVMGIGILNASAGWDKKSLRIGPGQQWVYRNGTMKPQDVASQLVRHPQMNNAYIEVADMERRMDRISTSTKAAQGESHGARTTADEAARVDFKGSARPRMLTQTLAQSTLGVDLADHWKLARVFMTEPDYMRMHDRISQKLGTERTRIHRDDIDFDVDLYIETDGYGSMNAQQLQGLRDAWVTWSQDPEGRAGMKVHEMQDEYFYRLGLKGYERFLEDPRAISDQVAMQEAAALASQGAGTGEGQPTR